MGKSNKLNKSKSQDVVEISKFKDKDIKTSGNTVLDLVSKKDLLERIEDLSTAVESLDEQIFEMRSLLQSGKGLGNILNLDQLLHTLMAIIRERYGLINSSVLFVDNEQNLEKKYFRMFAHQGIPQQYMAEGIEESINLFKFPVNDGLLWQIIKNGETFSVQDLKRRPRFTQAWQEWNLSVLFSDVWCPLIIKGEVRGMITLGPKKNGKQIQENEFTFINDLLAIAVTNIDSVMKYENNKIILKNSKILYDANQNVSDIKNKKNLCMESLIAIVKGLNAQAGILMLYEKETDKLVMHSSWNHDSKYSYTPNNNYNNEAILKKHTIRINDKENIEQINENIIYGLMITPLFRAEELVGVINLFNKIIYDENKTQEDVGQINADPRGRFSKDDKNLVIGLGDQVVANLHKLQLYKEAITDRLTGLYNSAYYQKEVERLVSEAIEKQSSLCLAVLDIDNFKNFNDEYGHKAGDLVLKEVGILLKEITPPEFNHLVFRYGGEEFCLIMPNTSIKLACDFLEVLRKRIEKHNFIFTDKQLKVTISGGIASLSEANKTASGVFLLADKALYESKENGRNKITATRES
ncbi:MAG: diguanylate cyclase [Bacteriovoracaceae bacterium]|jgi:diguanylate cyclase (GGDEF)-like protein|nr:diguanylate cyclase [Bacteriovoracaceae bacterium]